MRTKLIQDQADAYRAKTKAARERRAQRVAQKKQELLGKVQTTAAPVKAEVKTK